jgi:hypothetical protein
MGIYSQNNNHVRHRVVKVVQGRNKIIRIILSLRQILSRKESDTYLQSFLNQCLSQAPISVIICEINSNNNISLQKYHRIQRVMIYLICIWDTIRFKNFN